MRISAYVKRHPVLTYYALTFAISWGSILLLISRFGGFPATKEQLQAQLPFAILGMLGGPSVAGLILTGLVNGKAGLRGLLTRLLRWRVGLWWYVIALPAAPLVLMAALLALSLTSPVFLPGIFTTAKPAPLLLFGAVVGIVTGICEELGWTGFVATILRRRGSIVGTGLIMGVLWGLWHIVPMDVWGSRAYSGVFSPVLYVIVGGLSHLVGQLPPFRVLMVWVYDHTGSLLLAILMHASLTASTLILEPLAISGVPLLTYGLISATVMWVIVAAVGGLMGLAPR